jgi:hypothetical protein
MVSQVRCYNLKRIAAVSGIPGCLASEKHFLDAQVKECY